MKRITAILFICFLSGFKLPNATIERADSNHYAGTWYSLYSDIVARCEARGYEVSKLTCQNHIE